MTHPPKHIPPEVREKWLALRQKHQQDTSEFQARVAKDRAEFEFRVETARKGLLARHMDEESDFWRKIDHASKNTRKQPPPKAKTPATPTSARPATPSDRPRLSNTPAKAPQGRKSSQVPPAATQSKQQRPKKHGPPEVIDLISDDEDRCAPGKRTQATTANAATATASKQPLVQEIDTQGSSSPDTTPKKPSFTIPGATLELFGGPAVKNAVPHVPRHIKRESDTIGSSSPSANTPRPATPRQRQFHGLPIPVPSTTSPFAPRAFTEMPQAGSSGIMTPLASPSTPGFGPWSSARSDHQSSGFLPRAASLMPQHGQHLAANTQFAFPSYQQPGRFGPGSTASATPPSSSFTFQTASSSRFSSALSRAAIPDVRTSSPFGRQSQENRRQTFERPANSFQNGARLETTGIRQDGHYGTNAPEMSMTTSAPLAREQQTRSENAPAPQHDVTMSDATTSEIAHEVDDSITSTAPSCPSSANQHDIPADVDLSGPSDAPRTPHRQQLSSPPPSLLSVASKPLTTNKQDVSSPKSMFKKPSTPASAGPSQLGRQPIAAGARHVRAGTVDSRASTVTVPASSRDPRGASVVSQTSDNLSRTDASRTRKRHAEVSLSSDEDEDVSDYAPSDSDSPLAGKSTRRARNEPVAKKSKTSTSSVTTSQHASMKLKNTFGFKSTNPKPRAATTAVSSSNASSKNAASSASTASNKPSTPAPRTASKPAFTQPGKRLAAKKAEIENSKYFQELEEFDTECAIEEADQLEDARLPEDMNRMSITPSPSTRSRNGEETVGNATPMSGPKKGKNGYTYGSWTRDRMAGDRALSRARPVVEEDDSEIDTDGEVEELDLTGEA